MLPMFNKLLVSQLPMFWLKDVAPLNMLAMEFTRPVFQLPMFWLKDVAPLNMLEKVET
jgi:hypothetical protein